ncbi:MAG: TIGR04255 family protein [Methanosarcinales archaeon]|nr:TIGR04255 family protein [Methanosarcinales archaeon]
MIKLTNPPLVEAIFELRWNLQEIEHGIKKDPEYKLLVGRIFENVKTDFPSYEQLPTANMPDEMAGYIIQHRFRKNKDEWPLIQIGPGIITLNDTEEYLWENFKEKIVYLLETLYDTYPDAETNLTVSGLVLRYIDAVPFDFDNDDIFVYLKEKFKVDVNLYQKLFEDEKVKAFPKGLDLKFSFDSEIPKGRMNLRFARGKKKEVDALIWETIVQSIPEDTPNNKDEIVSWTNDAHDLTKDWFCNLIKGELMELFK